MRGCEKLILLFMNYCSFHYGIGRGSLSVLKVHMITVQVDERFVVCSLSCNTTWSLRPLGRAWCTLLNLQQGKDFILFVACLQGMYLFL